MLWKTRIVTGWLLAAACPLLAGDGIWTSEGSPTGVFSLGLGAPPRTLFASTWYGLARSTADGVWEVVPDTASFSGPVAVDPSNPSAVYAVGYQPTLLKSTDDGDHFQVLDGLSLSSLGAVAVDPSRSATVYAGGTNADGGAVFKSHDGGATWTLTPTKGLVDAIAALVVDPTNPDNLYAASDIASDYSYPGYPPPPQTAHNALIGSRDGGLSWFGLQSGSLGSIHALAVDPSGVLYFGASEAGDAVYRSNTQGNSWSQAALAPGLALFGINAIVVDPTNPFTVYAGTTAAGVFRSLDRGQTWSPMSDGLADDPTYGYRGLAVSALALDPASGVLYAGTENGVFAIRPYAPSPACEPAPDHLCLLGGRLRVTVMAQHPRSFLIARGVATEQANRFGAFSFPAFTGDATLPEVVVKVVEPSQGGAVWIYHGSLTSLPYVLTVTDTATGQIETYTNDRKSPFCGGADTAAFDPSPWDYRQPAGAEPAAASGKTTLSLLGGRFSATLSARGGAQPGVAVAQTDAYGYFSLPGATGDPSYPEVYVKMIDFRSVTGAFWVFYTGLTHADYRLTVTDSVTGAVRVYESGTPLCGGADTNAFTD